MLFAILGSPISGFKFVMRTLVRVAEEQWTDDAPLKEQLLELQMKLDTGEISEDEYLESEAEIMRALREIQNRKMELAGVEPEAPAEGLSGKVLEGSGVSLNWDPGADSAPASLPAASEGPKPVRSQRKRRRSPAAKTKSRKRKS
jgi:hypothetical protein